MALISNLSQVESYEAKRKKAAADKRIADELKAEEAAKAVAAAEEVKPETKGGGIKK